MNGARILPWLVLTTLVAGCRNGTAVTVTIDARDLAIPDQVAALHVRVTNPDLDCDGRHLRLAAAPAVRRERVRGLSPVAAEHRAHAG